MQSPFPGMDPYLEAPSLWPDVHHRLITAIGDQIQGRLGPGYAAVITPYVTLESIEIAPVRRAIVPDVGIVESPAGDAGGVAVAIAPPPIRGRVTMTVPTRYARLEIRTVNGDELVTAIELLSPANKRPGQDGAEVYEHKRQELFKTAAHLLEIDLLRAGNRPQVRAQLPPAPGFISLSRAELRPEVDIWPVTWQEPIPVVAVPLRHPDPDVPLDLSACLRAIYASARYERRVDYTAPPPPPEPPPEEAAWLDGLLRAAGLRR
ncbi:MAG TPA: DUF4058 family protein [Chloroflexaceae bacterium]|nr:DUF4058 family protein [Chloroflexaceae bacterium]